MRGTNIIITNNRILAKSARRTFRPHRRNGMKTPLIEEAKPSPPLPPEAMKVLEKMEREKWQGHLKAATFLAIGLLGWLAYSFL
ncbi:MAG: hypothetical protein AAGH79_11020 [Bacteroidota bacterium]